MAEKSLAVFDLVDEEIDTFDDRDNYQRTTYMYLQNDTPASIKICFMQANCRYDLPSPYIKDTGTFVAGVDGRPGGSIAVDPWDAGGRHAPIAATSGRGTCKLIYGGREYDVTLKSYAEAPEDSFYPQMGWLLRVEQQVSLDGQGVETVTATIMSAGLLPLK